jgi:hypothetical protein
MTTRRLAVEADKILDMTRPRIPYDLNVTI